jgi:lysine 6-dehydrogenase
MLVLGAGLQGSACAYDLLQNPEVSEVCIADLRAHEPPAFLKPHAGPRLVPTTLDVRDRDATLALMRESDAVMSAIPYYFNFQLAECAVDAGVHFCDLGGNTEIVLRQKALSARAASKGITVVPDCGVAPGMVNILAQHGIERLDSVDSVRIYVGGLPQHPESPLNYQIVYSLEGVLDYYTTRSWVVRDGKREQVAALSEREIIEFDEPIGALEAFHTAGGLSTMALRYEGRIRSMEYKTLRYPGHGAIMETIRELGLLDLAPVDVSGVKVVPRDVFVNVVGPKLTKPKGKDLLALRVTVAGRKNGESATRQFDLIDRHDDASGISAMMRTTGFSLSITGQMQVRGQVKSVGVGTPDEGIPAAEYISELRKRGIDVRES